MARTFIGELILRLKDDMSGKAKAAASNLDTSIDKIQRAARQLNQTSWGGQFEERLRKLGTSAKDIDQLRVAWDSLHTSMTSRNLSKSLQAMEKSNFKTAALGYFADIASKAKEADDNIGKMHSRWKEAAKDMAVYGTVGTLLYGGANAVRGGFNASAEYQREIFLQENASIPKVEQLKIAAEADRLTSLYPSAGLTNVMEMARQARNMMGTTDRGLAILPDLVKGLVALQTAKGVDAAPGELSELLRGIDNAGKNVGGPLGIQQTQEIIAGLIRASQIEGRELDVGSLWTFMRRAKIAGPGLSTEFLANVAPALIQDMAAPTAGTSLSSAFQAFVIGSNAVASKKNIAEQERLGIRKDGKLVNSQLMGENPYQWAKEVLLPALQKDGVDVSNNVAISEAIAKLSRNTPATSMLTKMLQQREQMDRLIEQYKAAAGPDSADAAAARDPFVAARGFTESLRELATSIRGMPEAVSILNSLTGGLQRFATALKNQDGGAQALLAGAGIGAGVTAWRVGMGLYGLMTAGTNLNVAAVALQAAAASLGGQGVVDNLFGAKKGGWLSKLGGAVPWIASSSWFQALISSKGSLATLGYIGSVGALAAMFPNNDARKPPPKMYDQGADANAENYRRIWGSRINDAGAWEGGLHRAYSGFGPEPGRWYPDIDHETRTDSIRKPTADRDRDAREQVTRGTSSAVVDQSDRSLVDAHQENAETRLTAGVSSNPQVTPDVDMSSANAAAIEATRLGAEIQNALGVSVRPNVDSASLRETLALVNAIKAGLAGIGPAIQAAHASVNRQMNRNFADHGVSP